jgi:hypothetical protein
MRLSVVFYVLWFNNLVFWLPPSSPAIVNTRGGVYISVWKPYPLSPSGGDTQICGTSNAKSLPKFFAPLYLFYPFNLNFLFIFRLSSNFVQFSLLVLCLLSYFPPNDIADIFLCTVYPLVNTQGSILPPLFKERGKESFLPFAKYHRKIFVPTVKTASLNNWRGSLPSVLFLYLSKSEYLGSSHGHSKWSTNVIQYTGIFPLLVRWEILYLCCFRIQIKRIIASYLQIKSKFLTLYLKYCSIEDTVHFSVKFNISPALFVKFFYTSCDSFSSFKNLSGSII